MEAVGAIWDARDDVPGLRFCIVEHAVHRGLNGLFAIAIDELPRARLPDIEGGNQCLEIAPVLIGNATVRQKEVEELLIEIALPEEFGRGNDQSLLLNIRAGWRDTARNLAPDVTCVDERPGETEQFAIDKDGLPDVEIGDAGHGAGRCRVIGDQDIAILVVRDRLDSLSIGVPMRTVTPMFSGAAKISPAGLTAPIRNRLSP